MNHRMIVTSACVLFILFVATLIRSAFGFGEALVAVPLLAFFIPLEVAAPLAVLVSITVAAIVVVQDWNKIHLQSTGWLVFSTLFGIPLGLLLLMNSHQRLVKGTLAVIIMAFAAYALFDQNVFGKEAGARAPLDSCPLLAPMHKRARAAPPAMAPPAMAPPAIAPRWKLVLYLLSGRCTTPRL